MKKIKNVQDLINFGFKDVAYPVIENEKLKFAKLREDGSFKVKGGNKSVPYFTFIFISIFIWTGTCIFKMFMLKLKVLS